MTPVKKPWLVPFIVLALALSTGNGGAQQDQPVDPWKFPKLTESKPFQRWWWAFQQRAFPRGEIPEDAKMRALQEIGQSKANFAQASQPVQGDGWINIGPGPIQGIFTASSGRVEAIAIDPSDATHWLIGAAQGGVWETHDAGASWSPKTDSQASLAMGAIAFAPSNTNIIYAGTGEAAFSADSYAGAGLLKSTDGGASWQLLSSSTFSRTGFSDIKVHPANSQIVLAATTRGLAGRSSASPPSAPARGVFKSTDGGVTWSQKLNGEATDLEVDPTNFLNQYAGIGEIFGNAANGVYRSINGGDTWTLISGPWSSLAGGIGRVELAISPSNPNTLYVSIQDRFDTPRMGNDGGLLGIWRTDNAWAATPTWTQLPSPSSPGNQLWYDHEIIVDPANSNIVYLGTTPVFKFNGSAWSDVSDGIHVDQHAMAFAGSRLIVGNDGGVWSTTNGGSTWTNHNTNLSITQFYDGSIHPTNSNFALGGSQDNGTEKWTGTNSWQALFGGDGAASAISSSNPNNNWAVSFQYLQIRRTTNGGASFTIGDTPESGDTLQIAPFIARFEKCPANDDVFIAGTDNVWRSNNFFTGSSPSWSDNLSGNFSPVISALAFAPSDAVCNTYAFGTTGGELRLTVNGGGTWTNIDVGNAVPNRAVTDLAFDPTNANVLYVTLSGFDEGTSGQPGHVFKSTNVLSPSPTWSNVSPPVNIPNNTIVVDSGDPNIVYVGTDLGIWKSIVGGASWTHMGPETGMPNVAVFDLKINNTTGRLIAFTHGRGAFVLTQTAAVIAVSPSSQDFGNVNIGSSADRNFTVQNVGGGTLSGSASTNAPYSIVAGGSYNLLAGQSQTVTIRFSPTSAGTFMGNVTFSGGGGATGIVSGVGIVTRTLTVASSNPSSGVSITVTPNDNSNAGNGTTQFTRTYNNNTSVTLTAAATAGGNNFSSWSGCDSSSGTICNVTMSADKTVTAAYVTPRTLTVTSTNPNTGASITVSPNDNSNQGNGTTQFTRTYSNNTAVTLVAASTAGGNNFSGWMGCNNSSGTICNVTMSADKTVTAAYGIPNWPDPPINLLAQCSANNTQATLSWSSVNNATAYALRVNYLDNDGPGCAIAPWYCSDPPDTFVNNYGGTSYVANVTPGHPYEFWVHGLQGNNYGDLARKSFTCGAPTHTLTVASSNPSSGVSITVSPNDNDSAGNGTTQFTRTYNNNAAVTLTAPPTVPAGNSFSNWTGCDSSSGTTCNVTMSADKTVTAVYVPPGAITLTYNQPLQDRVGQANQSRADTRLDPTFTVTFPNTGSTRTVTSLRLDGTTAGGTWDTNGGTGFWTLGAARDLGSALLNLADDSVNFSVAPGGSFVIFASEWFLGGPFPNGLFQPGNEFTLTMGFSDNTTATASTTIPGTVSPTVTIAAMTPTAVEGGASGAFTVTRTGVTASALTVNYAVGGTAVAGINYTGLSGSVVIPVNSSTAVITVTPVENNLVEGDKTVVVTLSGNAAYTVGSPSAATVTVQDNDAVINLAFSGLLADRVGQNNLSQGTDQHLDPTFTVTFPNTGGTRTVTSLRLDGTTAGGTWDTNGANGFWTLGAARDLASALLNLADDSVNFSVAPGGSFLIFTSDWFLGQPFPNGLFQPGNQFTLTIGFSDNSTGALTVTIPAGTTTHILTVASSNPTSGAAITVSPNDNSNQGNGTTQFIRTYNNNTPVILTAAATAGGNNFSSWSGCDTSSGTTCNVTMSADKTVTAVYVVPSSPQISLTYDGQLRDKVGQGEFALNPDGQLDGTFTVTLNEGSGSRTVSRLQLNRGGPIGVWDTQGGDGFWSLGVASGLDILPLLNAANDAVNFVLAAGSSFRIFAADYLGQMFVPGSSFTLNVNFSDGSHRDRQRKRSVRPSKDAEARVLS